MAYLSDYLGGGKTLQGKAGATAINANDLLALNAAGQLSTVSVSDCAAVANAGSAVIAPTTINSYGQNENFYSNPFVNPSDGSIFVGAPYLPSSYGVQISKYTASGALTAQIILSSAAAVPSNISITELTNGNLMVAWSLGGTSVYFAIIGVGLNIITAATLVSSAANYGPAPIALPGGGFALAYMTSTGVYFAVYSNSGSVVYAPALISGSTTTSASVIAMAVLSNGNIVVATLSSGVTNCLKYCIVTTVGASVVATTTLDANTGPSTTNITNLAVSALATGYFCVAGYDTTNGYVAYVLNNAGSIQGIPFLSGEIGTYGMGVFNDSSNFWLVCSNDTSGLIVGLPPSGWGHIATAIPSLGVINSVYANGYIVIYSFVSSTIANILVYKLSSTLVGLLSSSFSSGIISEVPTLALGTDYTIAILQGLSSTVFSTIKYASTAIVGISQTTVAAGNAGAIVNYSMGSGGYPCNPVGGTVGKGFDHSATNIIGNKGTILGNSAALQGIV